MPTNRKVVPMGFQGGWAPSMGPQAATVTHLMKAENVYYELDGGPHKMPGAAKLNSVQLTESGSAIAFRALFDYWKSGTGGTLSAKRMAYAGTQIWKEDLDGTWDTINTGLEANKLGWFTQYNDLCIWSSTSLIDVPQTWNQTDASTSALGGSPPAFSFAIPHRGRMWAAGVASVPSRLYYSVLDNPSDWTGSGSGSIDIDINDGDNITGLASHKQRLWIFKGPNRGSISYITGSSPTGTDAFARVPFSRGVPCASQQSVVTYLNDIAWVSSSGIHSLAATDQFGDMKEGFLSWPIQQMWQGEGDVFLDVNAMSAVQGVNHARRGVLLWTVRQSGQANNNLVIAYDYRFSPGRFSLLNAYSAASLAVMMHLGQPRLFSGGYDGYALRQDEANRNIANSAYTAKVMLPFVHHGAPEVMKQTAWLRVGIQPKGSSNITIQYQNDNDPAVTTTISQVGGGALDSFILDTDTLSGAKYVQKFVEIPGSYQSQQLQFTQGGLNEDMEIHEIAAQIEGAGMSEV